MDAFGGVALPEPVLSRAPRGGLRGSSYAAGAAIDLHAPEGADVGLVQRRTALGMVRASYSTEAGERAVFLALSPGELPVPVRLGDEISAMICLLGSHALTRAPARDAVRSHAPRQLLARRARGQTKRTSSTINRTSAAPPM
jgi:hypothetical protein